jgi:2-polyprenyl-6-methoxyphenol hydroxylase-like FAD-dependent oxidoreductase
VTGAGPGGLAAAINARLNGIKHVIVVDKHDEVRERKNGLGIMRQTMHNFAHLGISTARMERRGREKGDPRLASDNVSYFGNELVDRFQINDLEGAEAKRAAQLGGIQILYRQELVDLRVDKDGVTATTKGEDGQLRTFRSRWLAAADGAHSTVARLLKIGRVRVPGATERVLFGSFEGSPKRGEKSFVDRNDPRSDKPLWTSNLGIHDSTVGVQLAPRQTFESQQALEAFFIKQAKRLGVTAKLSGPVRDVAINVDYAKETAIKSRVFLLGDAARRTHPTTGLGVNAAIWDAFRLGAILGQMKTKTDARARAQLARKYAAGTAEVTEEAMDSSRWAIKNDPKYVPPGKSGATKARGASRR